MSLHIRICRTVFHVLRVLTAVVFGIGSVSIANAQGAGYWHTSSAQILDSNNQPVRIAGINWYGFETTDLVAHGLSNQDYKSILQTIKTQGYNTVRIPFSNQMVESPGTNLNITYWANFGPANSDLQGLNSLQVLDHIITYAGTVGLKVILDNHRSEAGNSAEANGLWYTGQYPESNWIADWQMLAARYAGNSTVIGMDLRNEPHNAYSGGACWDCGGANDWHLAAARGGNAVLAANPNLLIFVEGTDAYNNDYYWWGGNLEGVANSPVQLSVPNQLVYSAHDYGPNEYGQKWFNGSTTSTSLGDLWTTHWAFISQQGTAPVWLGEFGTENSDIDVQASNAGSQGQWFQTLTTFLKANPAMSWTYWALNGEDSYGLLDYNYNPTPVDALKQSTLATIQFPLNLTSTGGATAPAAPSQLSATAASASQINLAWSPSTTSGVTYTAFVGTSAGSIGTVLTSGLATASYTAAGLNASASYYFAVEAVSTSGNSTLSNTASATTQALPTTPAPGTPSAVAVSPSQINLSWLVTASGQAFTVYSGTSAAAVTTLVATNVQGTGYTASGLSPNTTYYFTIVGTTATATSAPSGVGSATTLAPPPPAAPSGLTAAAVSSSQINLSWTASSTAGVTYTLYSGSTVVVGGLAGTSYSVTGLAASTVYTYTVVAVLGGTPSTATNAASATTNAPVPPSAPSLLVATAVSSSQINLSWAASSSAGVTYTVYSGSTAVVSGLVGTSYAATGLTASTAYSYTVVAVFSTGTSTPSNVASATTQAASVVAPAAPFGLAASPGSASQVNLNWQPSTTSGVTYNVYIGTVSGSTSTLAATGVPSQNYAVTGLLDGTAYYFTVKAVSSGGALSAASNQATATTQTLPSIPPTGLTATIVSATQIGLTWTAVANSGATYAVYVGTSSGATNTMLATGISGTSYPATGLLASTTYYFVVRSISGGGTSSPSQQASATTLSAGGGGGPVIPPTTSAPSAPSGLVVVSASSTQIILMWSASSTAGVTYTVFSGSSSIASGLTSTSYAATGLTASTAYTFTVAAVNSAGTAASSPVTASTTAAPAPPAPTGLTATATSSSQITLSWTVSPTSGVTYTLLSGLTAGAETNVVAAGISGTSFSVNGLNASAAYYFVVKAVSGASLSAASNEATATTQAATAGGCHVTYLDQSDWNAGFTGNLSITNNGSAAWNTWTVTWTFSGNQQIYTAWNGNYTQSGQHVSIANAAWNGSVTAGGTVSGIGWNANYSGTNTTPATFSVNGVQCY